MLPFGIMIWPNSNMYQWAWNGGGVSGGPAQLASCGGVRRNAPVRINRGWSIPSPVLPYSRHKNAFTKPIVAIDIWLYCKAMMSDAVFANASKKNLLRALVCVSSFTIDFYVDFFVPSLAVDQTWIYFKFCFILKCSTKYYFFVTAFSCRFAAFTFFVTAFLYRFVVFTVKLYITLLFLYPAFAGTLSRALVVIANTSLWWGTPSIDLYLHVSRRT